MLKIPDFLLVVTRPSPPSHMEMGWQEKSPRSRAGEPAPEKGAAPNLEAWIEGPGEETEAITKVKICLSGWFLPPSPLMWTMRKVIYPQWKQQMWTHTHKHSLNAGMIIKTSFHGQVFSNIQVRIIWKIIKHLKDNYYERKQQIIWRTINIFRGIWEAVLSMKITEWIINLENKKYVAISTKINR